MKMVSKSFLFLFLVVVVILFSVGYVVAQNSSGGSGGGGGSGSGAKIFRINDTFNVGWTDGVDNYVVSYKVYTIEEDQGENITIFMLASGGIAFHSSNGHVRYLGSDGRLIINQIYVSGDDKWVSISLENAEFQEPISNSGGGSSGGGGSSSGNGSSGGGGSGGGGSGGGCYDSDGGINLYEKGIAAGVYDSCLSGSELSERYCTSSNEGADYVVECSSGICSNGACVTSSGGGGNGSGSSGNGGVTSCIDSDEGLNYYEEGMISKALSNGGTQSSKDNCLNLLFGYDAVLDNFVNKGVITEDQRSDENILIETHCPSGELNFSALSEYMFAYSCPNGCEAGTCIGEPGTGSGGSGGGVVIFPNESTGPIDIDDVIDDDLVETGSYDCQGCFLKDKCYPYNYRRKGGYCDIETGEFVEQVGGEEICENNFECKSNVCVNSQCVSRGLMKKILDWFGNIFG